jgi:hypothetical protein
MFATAAFYDKKMLSASTSQEALPLGQVVDVGFGRCTIALSIAGVGCAGKRIDGAYAGEGTISG